MNTRVKISRSRHVRFIMKACCCFRLSWQGFALWWWRRRMRSWLSQNVPDRTGNCHDFNGRYIFIRFCSTTCFLIIIFHLYWQCWCHLKKKNFVISLLRHEYFRFSLRQLQNSKAQRKSCREKIQNKFDKVAFTTWDSPDQDCEMFYDAHS